MSYFSFYGKGDKSIQPIFSPSVNHGVITNFSVENTLPSGTYVNEISILHNNQTREVIGTVTASNARVYVDYLKGKIIPSGAVLSIEVDSTSLLTLAQPQNIVFDCSIYVDDANPTGGGEVIVPYLVGRNSVLGDSCTTGTRLITFDFYGGNATVNVDTSLWTTNKDNVNMSIIYWTNPSRTTYTEIATVPQVNGGNFNLNIDNYTNFYGISLRGSANGVISNLCCQWDQINRKIIVNNGQLSGIINNGG